MSSRARAALVVPLAAALAAFARADTNPPQQTRATIRGSGNDITIVYRGGSPPRRTEAAPGEDVLSEAVRLAARGADDESIIAYLRTHQTELPAVTGVDAVRRLRKAGAGASVISDLSRLTALDIGETAEGAPEPYAGEAAPAGYGPSVPSADMGYPYFGSYGSSGFVHNPHHGRHFARPQPSMHRGPAGPGAPARPPARPRNLHAGMPRFPQP